MNIHYKNTINSIAISSSSIFYFMFGIWFFEEIMFNTSRPSSNMIDMLERCSAYLTLCMLLIILLYFQKYSVFSSLIIFCVSIIVLIATLNSEEMSYVCLWLFILTGKDISLKKVVKISYYILIISMILVFVLFFCGILSDYTIYRNGITRHSLGYTHPNMLGERIFQLVVCRCYLRWEKISFIDIVLVFMTLLFVNYIANSQTATICLSLFLFLIILFKWEIRYWKMIKKICGTVMCISSLLFPFISIWLGRFGTMDPLLAYIDTIFSRRFSYAHKVYLIYGSTLLGNRIYVSGGEGSLNGLRERLWLDNAYANLWLRMGILFMISILILYWITFWKFREYTLIAIIMFLFAMYGIMERNTLQLTHNVFLLLISWTIYTDKSKEEFDIFL